MEDVDCWCCAECEVCWKGVAVCWACGMPTTSRAFVFRTHFEDEHWMLTMTPRPQPINPHQPYQRLGRP